MTFGRMIPGQRGSRSSPPHYAAPCRLHAPGRVLLPCAILIALSACRTSPRAVESTLTRRGDIVAETNTLYGRDIVLSPEKPEDAWCGVRLVGVSSQGEATLRVLATGVELRASPGGYFSGEDFGRVGLEYLAFDPHAKRVTLRRYWCESSAAPASDLVPSAAAIAP